MTHHPLVRIRQHLQRAYDGLSLNYKTTFSSHIFLRFATLSTAVKTVACNGVGINNGATAGEDFFAIDTSVTFQAHDDEEKISISIVDDEDIERTEYFCIEIGEVDCGLSGDTSVRIAIEDNDGEQSIHISNATLF